MKFQRFGSEENLRRRDCRSRLVVSLTLALFLPRGVGAPPDTAPNSGPAAPSNAPAPTPAGSERLTNLLEEAPGKSSTPGTRTENPQVAGNSDVSNKISDAIDLPPELAKQAHEGKDEFDKGNYREAERL